MGSGSPEVVTGAQNTPEVGILDLKRAGRSGLLLSVRIITRVSGLEERGTDWASRRVADGSTEANGLTD